MSRTPDRPNFDQRIADWLEDDPDHAPGTVLATMLAAVPLIKQRRAVRAPWRNQPMQRLALIGTATAVIAVAGLGGLLLASRPNGTGPAASLSPSASLSLSASPTPSLQPSPSTTGAASPTPIARADYSDLGGRILVEHLGNAMNLSEWPTSDYHPERRRLYWMQPSTMTGSQAVEFLPDQPSTGKLDADVSRDGTKVVFMDTADPARVWIANTDGTGLRALSTACSCSELDPAFDPTGTKVVFVHLEGAFRNSQHGAALDVVWNGRSKVTSWLGIRDLATGAVTTLARTSATGADGLPYQPSWSPDGARIVFNRITWGSGDQPTSVLQVVDLASGAVRSLSTGPQASDPGDADWSPDGATIVFTNNPWSAMGSISTAAAPDIYTIRLDGTALTRLYPGAGASYLTDGRILFQDNYLWVMNGDGSGALPVNQSGSDLTELAQGFVYIAHWVGTP